MKRREQRRVRRLSIALIAMIGLLLLGALPVSAADRRSGDTVAIGAEEVILDDLYISGNTVTIDGTVKGDVLAAAGTLTINGVVEGDLMVAAQNVVINGRVSDDSRIMAASLVFGPQSRLGDDLIGGVAQLDQQAGATLDGDVYVGAGQARLAGTVGGDVRGGFQGLEVRGTIGGSLDVAVASAGDINPQFTMSGTPAMSVPAGLTIADSARINGPISYDSPTKARIGQGAAISGPAAWDQTPGAPTVSPADRIMAPVRRFFVLLIIGLVLLLGLPRWFGRMTATVEQGPLASIGRGLLGFALFMLLLILVPVAAILLMVFFGWLGLGGLIGVTLMVTLALLGVALSGFAIIVSYLAQVVVGYLVGRWILARIQPRWAEQPVAALALGLALYVLLRLIPGLGVAIALVVTLAGIGAVWMRARAWLAGRRGPAGPALAPLPQG